MLRTILRCTRRRIQRNSGCSEKRPNSGGFGDAPKHRRSLVHRLVIFLTIPWLVCPQYGRVSAQEPAWTGEELPFSEQYYGAMPLNSLGTQFRATHSVGEAVGRPESISSVEVFHPFLHDEGTWFTDLRLLLNNNADFAGNAGFGYRYFDEYWNRIFGVSVWYDGDDTHQRPFHQVGTTLETYGDYWDWLMNIYVPVGDTGKLLGFTPVSPPRFQANSILFDRVRFEEAAMTGLDTQWGVPVPGWLGEAYNIRAHAGLYYYSAKNGPDMLGVSGRVEGRVRPDLDLRVAVTNDSVFDTNVTFDVVWHLPIGRRIDSMGPTRTTYDRLSERIYRNYTVVVTNTATPESLAAIDAATNQRITVVHVNSEAAAGGDGTVERPFRTLPQAEAGSAAGNIILAHADSIFFTESITLQQNQRFLGQGTGIDHTIDTRQFGTVLLPNVVVGAPPEINGAAGNAVTLANGAEVSGFLITDPTGSAIFADGLSGNALVRTNFIMSGMGTTGTGVTILNSTGQFDFSDTTIMSEGTGAGFVVDGGAPMINFDGTIDNARDGRAVALTNVTGGTINFTGNIFDTEADGILVDNVAGDVSIAQADILDSSGAGVEIRNSSGNITLLDAGIDAAGGPGIRLVDNTGTVNIVDLEILNVSSPGLVANNGGTLNITGDATINSLGGAAVDITSTTLNATFSSLRSTNAATAGVRLVDVDGTFAVTGNTTINTPASDGILVQNSSADVTFSNVTVSNGMNGIRLDDYTGDFVVSNNVQVTGGANGVVLNNVAGSFRVDGDAMLNNLSGDGISVANSGGAVFFDSVSIDMAANGIVLNDNTGSFEVGESGGSIENFSGDGVRITDANALIRFLTIDAIGGDNGIVVNTTGANSAEVTLSNNTISGAAGHAIALNAADSSTLIATVADNDLGAEDHAFEASTSGSASMQLALSDNMLRSTNAAGANIDGSAGGTLTITEFAGNSVSGNATGNGGILVTNAIFDADPTTAGIQQVNGGNLTIGSLGDRVQGDGLRLDQVSGELAFANLNIFNDGGTGLFVRENPAGFTLASTGGTIDTINGPATDVDGATLDMVLNTLSSVDSNAFGLSLAQISGNFTVTGATSVTNAAGIGVLIADVTDAAAVLNFGAVNIAGRNDFGIDLDGVAGTVNFGATTIGAPASGSSAAISVRQMPGSGPSTGDFTFQNIMLTDGGIDILDHTGSFTVNGGLLTNSLGRGLDVQRGSADILFTDTIITTDSFASAINVQEVTGGSLVLAGTSGVTATNLAGGLDAVAIDANGADYLVNINSIVADDGDGLFLTNLGAGGSATFGDVTATNGRNGIELVNNAGSVEINGGDIQTVTGNGVIVTDSARVSLDSLTIDSAMNGVVATNTGADEMIFSLTNSTVGASGGDGVILDAAGTGRLAATINGNTITATGDTLNAIVSNAAGILSLNANDNAGNGAFTLNIAAGDTFQLGGTLGQGMTFIGTDNGNLANNGNTTNGAAPVVNATGEIEIVDPATIPMP